MAAPKRTPGASEAARGQADVTMYQNDNTPGGLRQALAAFILPWAAWFLTWGLYSDFRSRLLDKLIILSEGGRQS